MAGTVVCRGSFQQQGCAEGGCEEVADLPPAV